MNTSDKTVIGRLSTASFPAEGIKGVPVKIDTGADSSSIWASNIYIDDDLHLNFKLFAPESEYYSGKIHKTKAYKPSLIRVASGHTQVRYRVKLSIVLGGRRVIGTFTLADRSKNTYPVLVGCRLLKNKFLVDVSQGGAFAKAQKSIDLYDEFRQDPKAFFDKYHSDNERGDIDL